MVKGLVKKEKKILKEPLFFPNYLIFQQILILVGRTERKKVCYMGKALWSSGEHQGLTV
jgi:hypothetical protein